ncbi:MAG: hypothetical protein AABW64_01770 [Nanoarchaeota archaeon]
MHKGQVQYIPEILTALFGIAAYILLAGFLLEPASQQSPTSAATFSQFFDDYFLTFLHTPLPDSSQIPSSKNVCPTSFFPGTHTFGDLLAHAASLPAEERSSYIEPFRCYFLLFNRALGSDYGLIDFYLHITFPDNTAHEFGNAIDWQEKPAMSRYSIPTLDGKIITVAAAGRVYS